MSSDIETRPLTNTRVKVPQLTQRRSTASVGCRTVSLESLPQPTSARLWQSTAAPRTPPAPRHRSSNFAHYFFRCGFQLPTAFSFILFFCCHTTPSLPLCICVPHSAGLPSAFRRYHFILLLLLSIHFGFLFPFAARHSTLSFKVAFCVRHSTPLGSTLEFRCVELQANSHTHTHM